MRKNKTVAPDISTTPSRLRGTNRTLTGLASAAAIAGASQAYGAVVVVTPPANIPGRAPAASDAGTRVNIDLNNDGRVDLSLLYRNLLFNDTNFTLTYIVAGTSSVPGSTVGTAISGQSYAYSLAQGTTVGPSSPFYQKTGYFTHLVTNYNGTDYGAGSLRGMAGVPEYIGFKFLTTGGQTDYGYIQVETDLYHSASDPGGLKFLKLAYENSGAPIAVGAVPEPGTLTSLAMGAVAFAGVALKRRRVAAKA